MIMSNLSNLDTRIPLSLPHELMPIPTKPSGAMFSSGTTSLFGGGRSLSNCSSSFQLSANSSTVFEGNAHLSAGSVSMSATALLQKAAQMGATASPTTHKSFVAGMASSTFGPMQNSNDQSQVTAGGNGGFINQFFNANGGIENPAANDVGLINGVLDQTSGLFKNIEQKTSNDKSFFHGVNSSPGLISSGLTRFSGDVMTVDFLGVGGSRQRNLHEHHKQEMEFRGIVHPRIHQGLGQFEQTALEKPMWDV